MVWSVLTEYLRTGLIRQRFREVVSLLVCGDAPSSLAVVGGRRIRRTMSPRHRHPNGRCEISIMSSRHRRIAVLAKTRRGTR